LINWITPGTGDATLVNAPTFNALQGFTGANTKYIRTNFNPSVGTNKFSQNSASIGFYCRTTKTESTYEMGTFKTHHSSIALYNTYGIVDLNQTAGASSYSNGGNSSGMWVASRTASNVLKLYRNKVAEINVTTASTGVPNDEIYILCLNNEGTAGFFSTKELSMAFIGEGLSAEDVTSLTDAFEVYMDSNGKGVI
jgi:hypothetical protein